MKQNEAVRQAAEGFIDALYALHAMVLEIRLRVSDGSLSDAEVPPDLTASAVRQQQQFVHDQQQALLSDQERNRARLQEVQARIEDIQAFVTNAETGLAAMKNRREQDSQQQRLEQQYRDQTPEALQQELLDLEDERVSLQGALQLSRLHFDRHLAQLDGLEAALQPLVDETTLDTPQLSVSVDQATEATEALQAAIAAFETRMAELQTFDQQLSEVIDWGQTMETEADLLREHLANMRLLSELVVARNGQPPATLDPDALMQRQAAIMDTINATTTQLQLANEQQTQLQARLEAIRAAHLRARQQLVDVEQTLAAAQQARAWQQELDALDSTALLERFVADAQALQAQRERLSEQQQMIDALVEQERALRDTLNLFSDPLVELSQSAVQDEKRRIEETLNKLAGLEVPAESPLVAAPTETASADRSDDTDASPTSPSPSPSQPTDQAAEDAEAPDQAAAPELFSADVAGLKAYRNLIATRLQNSQTRQEDRAQLLEVLQSLETALTEDINQLSEAHRLLSQQYATAVELKKQLGRGALTPEQAPEGLIEALRKEPITALEQDIDQRRNQRAHTRRLMAHLQTEDPTQAPRQALVERLQSLVGQRLDLLADLQRLETQRLQQPDALSKNESQRLTQQAERRMRAGSGWLEALLGFLPSDRASELTELLRNHYQALVAAEARQELLTTEKDKLAQLIQRVQDTQQDISEFLPLLEERQHSLEDQQELAWMRLRLQFAPDEAETLLADFTARTGQTLDMPPPVLEADRVAFVEDAAGALLARHVQILALQQWIRRLSQRQEQTLVNEIAQYREREGEIGALESTLKRKIHRLLGHPPEALAELPENQRPTTALAKAYFLQGEIGVAHEERAQARLRALLQVMMELALIIGLTWLLIAGVQRLVDRKVRELEMSGAPETTHALFALSFGFAAFRILIIALALMLALSSLGFNIGVILAGLGIGGFAVAIAAKETLSNLIGGITLFVERPFSIGDIVQISSDIQLGAAEAGRVEGVSWRTTRIVNVMNYSITMPNSRVSEAAIINYTRQLPLRDFTHVYVSPAHEVRKVLTLITAAVDECQLIRQDMQKQILAIGVEVVGEIVLTKYQIRWYTDVSYLARARVLTEFWNRVWQKFSEAGVPLEYVARRSSVDVGSSEPSPEQPPEQRLEQPLEQLFSKELG
ncbi:mechanosensitive ion channel domain-containing protein [Rhabdochromatium marinum]|uniref:mechanosensitive ion channel domain-containing protein n=1 Tax=Rhabdochromatium marinum TaxID=48729 RepID=UPI0019089715|nr:mechanosensitive ion channel domain-containing protein [Rhabdochromatium marinum]MBK1649226.1 hypothetical protein [Rhabdochromatium marinum]